MSVFFKELSRLSKVYLVFLLLSGFIPFSVYGLLHFNAWLTSKKHDLWLVPDALHVSEIIYNKQQAWGFGPGGNESGLLIYRLPDDVALAIQSQGLSFFQNMPPNARSDKRDWWQGSFANWKETPIAPRDVPLRPNSETTLNNKYDYPVFYGFGIVITRDASAVYNQSMQQVGNFYARGRVGTIIVAPSIRRVIFAYDG